MNYIKHIPHIYKGIRFFIKERKKHKLQKWLDNYEQIAQEGHAWRIEHIKSKGEVLPQNIAKRGLRCFYRKSKRSK